VLHTSFNDGFDDQMISSRSGHRSNAVRLYKRPSVEQEKAVSHALDVPSVELQPNQTVCQPVECLYTRYNPLSNRFNNGFDNTLYRVNGVLGPQIQGWILSRMEYEYSVQYAMLC